jgi:hypothetical protein
MVLETDGSYPNSDGFHYFKPWPQSRLEEHPYDPDHTSTQEEIKATEESWVETAADPRYNNHHSTWAGLLCYRMASDFMQFIRKGPLGHTKFRVLSNWTGRCIAIYNFPHNNY